MTTTKKSPIEFKRVANDINGNPRYVCHFYNLLSKKEQEAISKEHQGSLGTVGAMYKAALCNAKKIGGKKFHNKQYGGGIVFQSYNIAATEKAILALIN